MEPARKVAVVTGGARRIGKAIALALARSGARVIITYHTSSAEAENTIAEIEQSGGKATAVQCDQRDLSAIDRLYERLRQESNRLDILVNNAAIMERQPVLDVTPADWSRVMDTNLRGPFFMAQQAARWMLDTGGGGAGSGGASSGGASSGGASSGGASSGVIVNIADLSALHPWPNYLAHTISKSGVVAMTQALALALAPSIRVNAVAPGLMLKPDEWSDERWAKLIAALPLQRAGTADDVAEAVLVAVRSDFMTGQTIVLDGGRTLRA